MIVIELSDVRKQLHVPNLKKSKIEVLRVTCILNKGYVYLTDR